MSQLAIVFIHCGWAPYLMTSLRQAVDQAAAPVYLISDCPKYAGIPGVQLVPLANLWPAAERFAQVYQHLSGNTLAFERLCWQRWFVLDALVQQEKLETAIYLDSDALLFASASRLAGVLDHDHRHAALCIPTAAEAAWDSSGMGSASGHCSVWRQGALAEFCSFAVQAFREGPLLDRFRAKWEHHRNAGLTGGVCDMTGLLAFAKSRPGDIANLLIPSDAGVVDDNMNTADNLQRNEFQTRWGLKQIRFVGGRPHLIDRSTGTLIPALVLHFQANAKRLMQGYASRHHLLLPALVAGWRLALTARAGVRRLCHAG